MDRITFREFQRNGSKYLDKLPLELTAYKKVLCIVNAPGKVSKFQNIKADFESLYGSNQPFKEEEKVRVRCLFCDRMASGKGMVFDPEVMDYREVNLCEEHLNKARKELGL